MAFFEDFGKKVSNASQTTIQKTKNMADIAKLNSMISDEEKKKNEIFLALGKLYYEKAKDLSEADFMEQIEAITAANERIEENKAKIEQIKKMGKCPQCGETVSNNSSFCSACGYRIEQPVEAEVPVSEKQCPNCGEIVAEGTTFCIYCGTKMTTQTETTTEANEN